MASGPGVNKPNRAGDPNRQPKVSQYWQSVSGTTGPMGAATHRLPDNDLGTGAVVWGNDKGHTAQVTSDVWAGGSGPYTSMEHNTYVAGPFRTQARSQVAAEALGNRVDAGGKVENYQADSWTETRKRR